LTVTFIQLQYKINISVVTQ